MDKLKKLESIANALQAVVKIKKMQSSHLLDNRNISVHEDNLCILCEALKIINDLSPRQDKAQLGEMINKTAIYSNTYRNLKYHLRDMNTRGFDKDMFLKTLNVIKPLLGNRYSAAIDKISKIHDILKS